MLVSLGLLLAGLQPGEAPVQYTIHNTHTHLYSGYTIQIPQYTTAMQLTEGWNYGMVRWCGPVRFVPWNGVNVSKADMFRALLGAFALLNEICGDRYKRAIALLRIVACRCAFPLPMYYFLCVLPLPMYYFLCVLPLPMYKFFFR